MIEETKFGSGRRMSHSAEDFRLEARPQFRFPISSFVFYPNMTNEADKLLIINRYEFVLRRVPFQSKRVAEPSAVSSKSGSNIESKVGMSFRIRSLKKPSQSPVCRQIARRREDEKDEPRKRQIQGTNPTSCVESITSLWNKPGRTQTKAAKLLILGWQTGTNPIIERRDSLINANGELNRDAHAAESTEKSEWTREAVKV